MATSRKRTRRLVDAHAFPSFRPQATVRGVFGDARVRVINLIRRGKKPAAAPADKRAGVGTTARRGGYATCLAAMLGSISSWKSDRFTVGAAGR